MLVSREKQAQSLVEKWNKKERKKKKKQWSILSNNSVRIFSADIINVMPYAADSG